MSKNIDKSIFGRLSRLWSTDVIIRNVGGNQLKVMDTERIQSLGNIKTNSLVDRFTRLHTYGANMPYNPTMNYQTLRTQLYTDYDAMDTEPIIASALDIISDECTLKNEFGDVISIKSSDDNIQRILYNLFYDILNIEFNLWTWIRNMCKYGDFYLKLDIAEKFGIYNVIPLSAYNMMREEGYDENNPSAIRFRVDPTILAAGGMIPKPYHKDKEGLVSFDNYEIAHFRLIADANYLPYGRSYIEPARKVYKQYILMKDAMLLHRITRAPEKRIYYVNVGNLPANEIDAYMQKLIQRTKKAPFIDQSTGEYNLKYNVNNMMEDYYIPVRGQNDATKIDTAPGLVYNAIEDVQFLRDEMLSSLKIPKAFFGFEKDLQGKATLAAEDIRFARTIERIQRIVLSELTKIALIHLYVQGYDGESLTNFELHLTTPSIIFEQEKIALYKEKVGLAQDMINTNLFSSDWIYDKIFNISEDEINEMRDLVLEDKKRIFRSNQIENEGNDPARSGKSYGTPHNLAMAYSKERENDGIGVPNGYDEKKLGRPKEKISNINTQENPLGKDRLGNKELSDNEYSYSSSLSLNEYRKIEKQLKEGLKINIFKNN